MYSGCQYKWEEEELERGDGAEVGGLDVPDLETGLGHRHKNDHLKEGLN